VLFPEWEHASLVSPQTYYDLQGRVISYQFAIVKDSEPIGNIMVGSLLYDHVVMQAGSSLPPSPPSPSEVALAASRDLGIQVGTDQIKETRRAYLGFSSYAALYSVRGRTIAFDLRTRQAVDASELKTGMASPEEYHATRSGAMSTLSFEYANLPVPVRNMESPPDYENNCGPTAGAMIAEYYKQEHSYSSFDDWYDDHDRLYETMETNQNQWFNGTMPADWGPGFVAYADEKSYSFATFWVGSLLYNDYAAVKNYIDNQRPIGLLFWYTGWTYNWHYVAVRGYWLDDSSKDLIINDGWGSTDLVSWDVYYGAISLHFLYPD
jgi:hypothetical protein